MSCTIGGVVSTSTRSSGESPGCGGPSLRPAPLVVTSRRPNTPWPGSLTVTGDFFSTSSAQKRQDLPSSSVRKTSTLPTPDGPHLISYSSASCASLTTSTLGNMPWAVVAPGSAPATDPESVPDQATTRVALSLPFING